MGITVMPLTETIAERAAELRASHERLRLRDAIVLVTAREEGGELLGYDGRLSQLASKHLCRNSESPRRD
jgi:predicted nucleic acid-binding protein